MDLDDFRSILDTAGVDVWTFIDTAIQVANLDYGPELKEKRDKIVERLFASSRCRNCDSDEKPNGFRAESDVKRESKGGGGGRSPSTPQSVNGDDELDPFAGLFDDEQKSIFEIKELLEDPNQSEESIVDLLQNLADMDINFQALQETDIGRHVNKLRKHSSNEVKRLVKHLVRKWKEIVDDWVRVNNAGYTEAPTLMGDGDSPLQKFPQNGHHQVPDFAYSPNPHNGSSGSDKNHSEPERKLKSIPPPRKELPPKPARSTPPPAPQNVQRQREPKEMASLDSDRFASARKRLQENYKEAENAKKQRTIQVMDIHQLPKPKAKNAFFAKHKPGGSQGRHW